MKGAAGRGADMPARRNASGESLYDALVIGAGPAGLTAALYLARYRRRTLVLHDGRSRALGAPMAWNVPGFPDGISGADLVARLTEQAGRYGAEIELARVVCLSASAESASFAADLDDGRRLSARGLVLASGVITNKAVLDSGNHDAAVRNGALRYCPICDGYEHRGRKIAVLGSDLHGAAEAMFLRQYTDDVTLIPKWQVELTSGQRAELLASDVKIEERQLLRLAHRGGRIEVKLGGAENALCFDTLYPALGSQPRSELLAGLGLEGDADRCLPADAFAEPLMPGVYGAGDVLAGLDQISTATGHGAAAATRLHNWLRGVEGHVMADQH
jgi:thioredoxin reductase (NADPH)